MLVNITFPVFDEEAQLAASLRRVGALLATQPQHQWELVVADNGSRDRTLEEARTVAKEWDARFRMPDAGWRKPAGGWWRRDRGQARVGGEAEAVGGQGTHRASLTIRILHWDEAGRGRALKGAWLGSEADVLSYMDIDLSTDLAHLPALIAVVADQQADLVVGSRLAPGSQTTRGWKRELLSRGYNRLLQAALGLKVRDAQCGFKAISRAAARSLLPQVRDPGFFFDTELLVLAQRQGWRIHELPVRWMDDPDTRVHLGRTIWRDLQGVWRMA